jgi:hypothetical protein
MRESPAVSAVKYNVLFMMIIPFLPKLLPGFQTSGHALSQARRIPIQI